MERAKLLIVLFIGAFLLLYPSAFMHAEENYPQRIVSLGPAMTEELYILGVEDRLVGCTMYCQQPSEAKEKEKVGMVIEVNVERIVSLKPDLVLATSVTSPEAKEKLENLGIKVIAFPEAKNFNEICEHFLEIGKIVGKEKEAEKIVSIAKDKVDSVKKKVQDFQKPTVFIQEGARPLVTATRDSFVNDFIEFAGGINNAQGSRNRRYSREKVLEDNPDVIIIVTMGINGEEEKKTWQKFGTLNAVKNNRIYIIDSHKIATPTPLTFVETLEEIVEILHPRLKGQ